MTRRRRDDMSDDLEGLADVLRRWAGGPDWRRSATAWPLAATGGTNKADDWYGLKVPALARRDGHPAVTVHNNREWAASVIASPSGKSIVVAVPRGTTVVEVDV